MFSDLFLSVNTFLFDFSYQFHFVGRESNNLVLNCAWRHLFIFSLLCTALTVSPVLQSLQELATPHSEIYRHPPSTSLKSSHHSSGKKIRKKCPSTVSHTFFYKTALKQLTSNCISLAMSSWILWALSVKVEPSRLQRAMMASISVRYLQHNRKLFRSTSFLIYFSSITYF